MSRRPRPPGRFDAMYRLRPSGAWIGHPSRNGVFSSELQPGISSIFVAVPHGEKCIALAAVAAIPTRIVVARSDARLLFITPPLVVTGLDAKEEAAAERQRHCRIFGRRMP
jgi:hypothetical protein